MNPSCHKNRDIFISLHTKQSHFNSFAITPQRTLYVRVWMLLMCVWEILCFEQEIRASHHIHQWYGKRTKRNEMKRYYTKRRKSKRIAKKRIPSERQARLLFCTLCTIYAHSALSKYDSLCLSKLLFFAWTCMTVTIWFFSLLPLR